MAGTTAAPVLIEDDKGFCESTSKGFLFGIEKYDDAPVPIFTPGVTEAVAKIEAIVAAETEDMADMVDTGSGGAFVGAVLCVRLLKQYVGWWQK